MPILYVDDSKFTVSDDIVAKLSNYVVTEDDRLYVHLISKDTLSKIISEFRHDYDTVMNSINQSGGFSNNLDADAQSESLGNIIKLNIPDSDDKEEYVSDDDIYNATEQFIDMIGGELEEEPEPEPLKLDTSVIYSDNKEAINELVNTIENGLNSNASMNIINQISTDPNIIKFIQDYNAQNEDADTDSLNVPDSFFATDNVTETIDPENPSLVTRFININ